LQERGSDTSENTPPSSFSNKGEEKGRGCYALAVGNTTREHPRLLPVHTKLACLHPRGQDLAVARNPIQTLVVGDLITTGPTAEYVRVLARLVVYEGIIPRPAKVFLRVQVSHDLIGPSPAVVLVFAIPVIGVTARDVFWAPPASDDVVAKTEVDFVPPVGADQDVVCLSATAGPAADVAGGS
jgi:hypothetical protein